MSISSKPTKPTKVVIGLEAFNIPNLMESLRYNIQVYLPNAKVEITKLSINGKVLLENTNAKT